jgi:DNA recombination protein Rad52
MTTTTRPAASRPATPYPAPTRPAATSTASTRPASSANGPRSIQLDQASANGPTALQLLRQPLAAESTTEPGTATTPTPLISSQAPDPISPAPAASAGSSIQQIAALAAPLNRALVSSREQGRGQVCYLQSWVVINEANRIFGFDGWQRQTLFCHCVAQAERLIGAKGQGREQKSGWGVTYIVRVRITVSAGNQGPLIREGTGAGHGIDTDQGLAHESAIKEAETDAMKRALITFGNPFGLALYDKQQRQVSGGGVGRRPEQVSGIAVGQGQGQVSGSRVG